MPRALLPPLSIALMATATGLLPPAGRAQPAGAPPPVVAAMAASRVTVAKDNLWTLARAVQPPGGVTRQQVMVAILRANPEAFEGGNMHRLRRGVTLTIPPLAAAAQEDREQAAQLVEAHRAHLSRGDAQALAALPGLDKPSSPSMPAPAATTPTAPGGSATPASDPAPTVASPPAASAPPASGTAGMSGRATEAGEPDRPGRPGEAPAGNLPWGVMALGVALAGAAVWIWRRPRAKTAEDAALPSTFLDEEGLPRKRRPRILEVSEAAAEMARTVETLQPTQGMVQRPGAAADLAPAHALDVGAHAELQLELARALMAIGRGEAARVQLLAVLRSGPAALHPAAEALLAPVT